jgi:uncharacterized membrane protein
MSPFERKRLESSARLTGISALMLALSTLPWLGYLLNPAYGWIWASMVLAILAMVGMIRAFTLRRPHRAILDASKWPDKIPDDLNQEAEQDVTPNA